MSGLHWFDAAARSLFESQRLTGLEDFCRLEAGEVITSARTRWLRRIEVEGQRFYVKVQDLRRARLPLRRIPSYLFRGSPVTREARALAILQENGFRTPPLVATGQRRGVAMPQAAVLITRSLDDHVDLARFAQEGGPARAVLAAAEELVKRVHARGLVLLGAKYRNILTPAAGTEDPTQLVLLDQPDLRRTRSPRLRAKDWRHMRRDRERYAPNFRGGP